MLLLFEILAGILAVKEIESESPQMTIELFIFINALIKIDEIFRAAARQSRVLNIKRKWWNFIGEKTSMVARA